MSPQGFANQKLVCKMLSFTNGGRQKQAKAAKMVLLLLLGAFILLRSLPPSKLIRKYKKKQGIPLQPIFF